MPTILKNILSSFFKRPDIWFFFAFLVTSTLSIRKVLFFYPIENSFNEYTGVYIYLSDIFLLLTLFSWLIILYNNFNILSIISTPLVAFRKKYSTLALAEDRWNIFKKNYIENVPRGTFLLIKKVCQQVIHNFPIIFPLLLAIFSFTSILWATNKPIAFFRSFKTFEFVLLYFYIIFGLFKLYFDHKMFHACLGGGQVEHFNMSVQEDKKCSTWNILKGFLMIIIIIGLVQSIIGITQFCFQHSIGFLWLKESIISPETSGVAKVVFDGNVFIRAYGFFPHPNIFGGFLVFSIFSSIFFFKMFHVEHFEKVHASKCSTLALAADRWNVLTGLFKKIKNVPRGTFLMLIVSIQVFALILTFSKSAIVGLFIGFFYILIIKKKMFHVEHFCKKLFLIISISILLLLALQPKMYSFSLQSLQERIAYMEISRRIFFENPFFGIGSGQFVVNIQNTANFQIWQFQPVHNVFLLVLNEFGIFVLLLFLLFTYKMFHVEHFSFVSQAQYNNINNLNVPRGTLAKINELSHLKNIYFKAIFLAFVFIMFFDHYFWDIQQGQILFWVFLGFIVVNYNNRE